MSHKRFDAKFRLREDLFDPITPQLTVNEDIRAPAAVGGQWKPAAWLPIQFTKTNANTGTDAFVISSGKVVAMDTEGRIVPAGMRTLLKAGAGALTYTSTDVDWGVVDLTTGSRVTAAVSYSTLDVGKALLERGLVLEQDVLDAGGTVPPTTNTQAETVIDQFISRAIGVMAYDVHVWSGLPEDGDQFFVNYSKQHAVQFLTEIEMKVPHLVPGSQASDTFDPATLDASGSTAYVAGDFISPGQYWDAANFSKLARYSSLSATTPAVALGLDPAGTGVQYRVARNTDRTPFTTPTSGVLVRERSSPGALTKEGDWYLDADVGVLFLHTDTWATLVAAAATIDFSYSYYTVAAATAHRYMHFDGPAKPGDFVTFDEQSNFVAASEAAVDTGVDIVGRVHRIVVEPRGLLDKVKTAWSLSGVSATSQMPGSASKGFSDLITFTDEKVADQVVIVTVRV